MEYCSPLGIPHSKFLEWSDEDRDKAISYMLWKKKFCSRCGTDPDEWLDPDRRASEPPPYEATTRLCLGCATLEEERELRHKESATSTKYQTYLTRFQGGIEEWQMRPSR